MTRRSLATLSLGIAFAALAPTAYADPITYDVSATYSGGTISGSFTFDPASAPSYCAGSPTSDCYWNTSDTGSFSTTGTYEITADETAVSETTDVHQTLWSFPNPTYQEIQIVIGSAAGNLDVYMQPAPYTDVTEAVIPTGTFTTSDLALAELVLSSGFVVAPEFTITAATETVPEPGSIALVVLPLAALAMARRQRRV